MDLRGCVACVAALLLLAAVSAANAASSGGDLMRAHDARIAGEVVALVAEIDSPPLRALLLDQPPFDGSVITQAYLALALERHLKVGTPNLASAYGEAAADTLAHMAAFGVPYRPPPPFATMNHVARAAYFAPLAAGVPLPTVATGQLLRLARRLSVAYHPRGT